MESEDPRGAHRGSIWPKLSILLVGITALGLLVLMCLIVVLVAYLRGL